MNEEEAAEKLGQALQSSFDGILESISRLERVYLTPINYTRWESWRIYFWLFLRNPRRAQIITMDAIMRQLNERAAEIRQQKEGQP